MKKNIFLTALLITGLFTTVAYAHPADISPFLHDAHRQIVAPYTAVIKTQQTLASEVMVFNLTGYGFEAYFNSTYVAIIAANYIGPVTVPFDFSTLEIDPLYRRMYNYTVTSDDGHQTATSNLPVLFSGLGGSAYVLLYIIYA